MSVDIVTLGRNWSVREGIAQTVSADLWYGMVWYGTVVLGAVHDKLKREVLG